MGEKEEVNNITEGIIGAAIEVHRHLGPGLLESAYQAALAYELNQRGYKVEQKKPLPMLYKEIRWDAGYRLDFLVNDKVILEIKSSDKIIPIHDAQILSYIRL
jgi:GxxExxY protein